MLALSPLSIVREHNPLITKVYSQKNQPLKSISNHSTLQNITDLPPGLYT